MYNSQKVMDRVHLLSEEQVNLLSESIDGSHETRPVELNPLWQTFHALFFATGGTTFIAGTSVLYFPSWSNSALWSAILYIVGSLGFLAVDLQEFWTYADPVLRFNIALSASGSLLYVIGSLGFLPVVFAESPIIGLAGFIGGSVLIGISQLWKVYRYATTRDLSWEQRGTAIGVELSAGMGAWLFFIGTVVYALSSNASPQPSELVRILDVWIAGSIFFTIGAAFLTFRHACMRVS